jgi:tetrapyrrole methylase family protein / MazG family protein
VDEELKEVREAKEASEREDELGDLLFSMVNLIRWYKADAESVLRKANIRFSRRFAYVEERARAIGRNLHEMSLEEMDVFWDEAKSKGF